MPAIDNTFIASIQTAFSSLASTTYIIFESAVVHLMLLGANVPTERPHLSDSALMARAARSPDASAKYLQLAAVWSTPYIYEARP